MEEIGKKEIPEDKKENAENIPFHCRSLVAIILIRSDGHVKPEGVLLFLTHCHRPVPSDSHREYSINPDNPVRVRKHFYPLKPGSGIPAPGLRANMTTGKRHRQFSPQSAGVWLGGRIQAEGGGTHHCNYVFYRTTRWTLRRHACYNHPHYHHAP